LTKPAAKLIDVARLAGVCNATVSRALSRPASVNAETRRRVEAAALQLGYVPDGTARALRARRTLTVGAILPTLNNPLYAKATHALQHALDEGGYTLLLACHDHDAAAEVKIARSLIERGVDGVVLISGGHAGELFTLLAACDVPYVLTWTIDAAGGHPCVGFDNRIAAMRIVDYVADIGHRDIALICGVTAEHEPARERLEGARAALAARGIALPPQRVVEAAVTLSAGRAAMRKLLALAARPTAVICTNDVLAMGAVFECQAQNLHVPGAISVTGFDDAEAASILVPALTTVRVPMRELGYAAARQMLARLNGAPSATVTELPVDLIVRGTTAPPPGGAR
jgi:LacI family transcriptional regulator